MNINKLNKIGNASVADIKGLAIFTEATRYIYQHFTTSADDIKDVRILPNRDYGITVEEIINQITDQTITTRFYENILVRAYGTLEVYIQKIATLIINTYPTKYIGSKDIKVSQLFGDIEKIKRSFIDKAVVEVTSNKNMYDSVINLLKPFDLDLSKITEIEIHMKDIYALRNLIVHKNCEIDSKFISTYSHSSNLEPGTKFEITYAIMTSSVNKIFKFMSVLYDTLSKTNWNAQNL